MTEEFRNYCIENNGTVNGGSMIVDTNGFMHCYGCCSYCCYDGGCFVIIVKEVLVSWLLVWS